MLFMDIPESLPAGATVDAVAGAHAADVKVGPQHAVTYQRYWVDEASGKVFCLVEAPDAAAAIAVHREAHGLVADRIFPVVEGA
jgi:hypothetical protein